MEKLKEDIAPDGGPTEQPPWRRMPGEPHKAFECFHTFLVAGPGRKLVGVFRDFYGRPEAKDCNGTWKGWVRNWNWHARCEAYDRYMEAKLTPLLERQEADAHLAKLAQYQDLHERCGVKGMGLADDSIEALGDYIKRYVPEREGMAPERKIESLAEARHLAVISAQFLTSCSQVWGEALGIPELTEMAQSMRRNESP